MIYWIIFILIYCSIGIAGAIWFDGFVSRDLEKEWPDRKDIGESK